MDKKIINLSFFFILLNSTALSEVNEKQKKVIQNQLFLLNEGLVSKEQVYQKAKMFDSTGVFGIGADRMSEREFQKFLDDEATNSEN